jgi:cytosine/adenosine deaminase-related metal-dependent hydrolase
MRDISKYLPEKILLPDGQIHTGTTLSVSPDGQIIGVSAASDHGNSIFLEGVLVPGFINGHCHLELSGLKGMIPQDTRLDGFIREMVKVRGSHETDTQTMKERDLEMWQYGIQGVGDICNTSHTIEVKKQSRIRYHSFIELFDLSEERTPVTIENGIRMAEEFKTAGLSASLAPHAPYTVSSKLLTMINEINNNSISSMHFLEDGSERDLLDHRSGALFNTMNGLGVDFGWLTDPAIHGIKALNPYWMSGGVKILVHNTYIEQRDIDHLRSNADMSNIWFCICPNANHYIERRLPDMELLMRSNVNVMIGTDSLASNEQLSVIDEVNTILRNFPHFDSARVLSWATAGGAEAFGWNDLGKFERGRKPGGVLLKGEPGSYVAERVF